LKGARSLARFSPRNLIAPNYIPGTEPAKSNPNHLTIEQLSVLIDQTPRTIHKLSERGVLKRAVDEHGKKVHPVRYDLIANVRAYCAYLREAARLDDIGQTLYQQLRNKKMGAEAEKAVIDLQLYKQKVHEGQHVAFVMTTIFTAVKQRMLSIPSRVTRVLMGKTDFQEIYAIINDEIEMALRELSEYDPSMFAAANEEYLAMTGANMQPSRPNGDSNNHHQDSDDDGNQGQAEDDDFAAAASSSPE
jgi:phage terminase Nu1 subunit (DNA packaging protein)